MLSRLRQVAAGALAVRSLILVISIPGTSNAVEFLVSDQNGDALANAVVTVNTVRSADVRSGTEELVIVEQRGQQFHPRVTVIPPGSAVRFPNRDLTQHHVYSFSQAKAFEIELYGGDEPAPVLFEEPGIVSLGCNIHDWMLGYIYVTPDDLFAISSDEGFAQIQADVSDIQSVTVWHPGIEKSTPVTLAANQLPPKSSNKIELVVRIPSGDPLQAETDPLQGLFED